MNTPGNLTPPSIEERELQLKREQFEFEQRKYADEIRKKQGVFGFVNNNLGIVLTGMIGLATVIVSYLQLEITSSATNAQLSLEREKAKMAMQKDDNTLELERQKAGNERAKNDRAFQFDLSRMLLERHVELNTADLKEILYLRNIVMTTLPADLGIAITKKMAANASALETRAAWLDGLVELQISSRPQPNQAAQAIDFQYVITKFPRVNKSRLENLLAEMQNNKLSDIEKATLLAYILYNSTQLNELEESFKYTSAARILVVFPNVFANRDDAERLLGKPPELANIVYGPNSPMGKALGNQQAEDGWKFRGRGYLQTTGRENYYRSGTIVGVDLLANPNALLDDKIAAKEAVAKFLRLTDRSLSGTFRSFTGGISGLAEVQKAFQSLVPEAADRQSARRYKPGRVPTRLVPCPGFGELH